MSKLSKSNAGYTYHPDSDYLCGQCVLIKPVEKRSGCAWFGPSTSISATAGSCNYFAHAHPSDKLFDVPWFGLFTPPQLGYMENRYGFGCKRCEHFSPSAHDCSAVDRQSEGDTPGEISPGGCCNLWERDRERGGMTRPQLDSLMESIDQAKKAIS